MNTILKAVASVFVGALALVLVGGGVTAVLDPYVWPALMLGLPAGLVAGLFAVPLTYLGLTYWAERAESGRASARTSRRFWALVGGVAGFVVGGGLAMAVLATQAVGVASAMLFGGFPVGFVAAALAAFLVFRRVGGRESERAAVAR